MLGLYGGATGLVIELAARKAIEAFSKKSTDSAQTSAQLSDEAQKAELQSLVFQSQAKVQQELAIARRILAAEEVEIEEFYDGSASAELGAKASTEKVSLGSMVREEKSLSVSLNSRGSITRLSIFYKKSIRARLRL